MALGAQTSNILRLVIRQGMWLALIGLCVGIGGAIGLTRLIESWLYKVSATDLLTFTLIAAFIAVIALLACYMPARRAARVDPIIALRDE
jgi:ABC-type antimicrobial peptide transport system permease subunit